MTQQDKDRAAFEARMQEFHTDHSLEFENGWYRYSPTQKLWFAWQAAVESVQQGRGEPADATLAAHTDLMTYVLQDDVHNRLTPRVVDIAYTAFMQAKRPNDEDGGASDWFNDTKPVVMRAIEKLRNDLFADRAANVPQPAEPAVKDSLTTAEPVELTECGLCHNMRTLDPAEQADGTLIDEGTKADPMKAKSHVGESRFESWYSEYSPAGKCDKQRSRDAYAAGMSDPLVTGTQPVEPVKCDHPQCGQDVACNTCDPVKTASNLHNQMAYIAAYNPDEFEGWSHERLWGWGMSIVSRARSALEDNPVAPQPADPAAWYALLQAAEEMSQASHVLAGTDERNRLLRAIEAAKAQQPAKAMGVVTNVPVPSEQQIIEAAERAGLWPNTVRNWIPQFKRYHEIIARHGQPAQPADMEDVYIDEKGFVWNQPSAAVYARVAKAYNALIYESGQEKGAQPAASVEPVDIDDFRTCAIADSNYAAGMLLGWNLCLDDDEAAFGRIRGDRLRAAAQASRVAAPVAAQPSVPDHLIKRLLKHAENKENTAFARSAMREVVQYLTAPPENGQAQQEECDHSYARKNLPCPECGERKPAQQDTDKGGNHG